MDKAQSVKIFFPVPETSSLEFLSSWEDFTKKLIAPMCYTGRYPAVTQTRVATVNGCESVLGFDVVITDSELGTSQPNMYPLADEIACSIEQSASDAVNRLSNPKSRETLAENFSEVMAGMEIEGVTRPLRVPVARSEPIIESEFPPGNLIKSGILESLLFKKGTASVDSTRLIWRGHIAEVLDAPLSSDLVALLQSHSPTVEMTEAIELALVKHIISVFKKVERLLLDDGDFKLEN